MYWYVWVCMGIDGYVRVYMGIYGYVWVYMGMYAYVWVYMGCSQCLVCTVCVCGLKHADLLFRPRKLWPKIFFLYKSLLKPAQMYQFYHGIQQGTIYFKTNRKRDESRRKNKTERGGYYWVLREGGYILVPIHTNIHPYLSIHTHKYPYIPINTHKYAYIPIYTHTYPYISIHTHTYPYILRHTYLYPYILYSTVWYPFGLSS